MSTSATQGPTPRGMPILSGPPPVVESPNCRQCDKQFNALWRRSHTCGHCGYEYCSACISDGQALMPRRAGQSTNTNSSILADIRDGLGLDDKKFVGGGMNGYEVESVCLRCLSMLQVTAAPLQILRSLPLKRLKEYLTSYDIQCIGPKEKEDFVQAVVKARNPSTGCLPPEHESFYRRKSVPKDSQSSMSPPTNKPLAPTTRSQPASNQARPSPPGVRPQPSNRPPPPQYAQQRPPPPSHYARPPPPRAQTQARPSAPRPTPVVVPTPPPQQPAPPIPSILSLVSLPNSYLSNLSIGTLKAILYENHVKVDFKQVLEKEELIKRVAELMTSERKRLERQRYEEEREAQGANITPPSETVAADDAADGASRKSLDLKPIPTGPPPDLDRGLCIVCQDEEATLAVVDCGHLCMCAHCSDLIMASSKECPLCRTRIVTPQRLIRIYRV